MCRKREKLNQVLHSFQNRQSPYSGVFIPIFDRGQQRDNITDAFTITQYKGYSCLAAAAIRTGGPSSSVRLLLFSRASDLCRSRRTFQWTPRKIFSTRDYRRPRAAHRRHSSYVRMSAHASRRATDALACRIHPLQQSSAEWTRVDESMSPLKISRSRRNLGAAEAQRCPGVGGIRKRTGGTPFGTSPACSAEIIAECAGETAALNVEGCVGAARYWPTRSTT